MKRLLRIAGLLAAAAQVIGLTLVFFLAMITDRMTVREFRRNTDNETFARLLQEYPHLSGIHSQHNTLRQVCRFVKIGCVAGAGGGAFLFLVITVLKPDTGRDDASEDSPPPLS